MRQRSITPTATDTSACECTGTETDEDRRPCGSTLGLKPIFRRISYRMADYAGPRKTNSQFEKTPKLYCVSCRQCYRGWRMAPEGATSGC